MKVITRALFILGLIVFATACTEDDDFSVQETQPELEYTSPEIWGGAANINPFQGCAVPQAESTVLEIFYPQADEISYFETHREGRDGEHLPALGAFSNGDLVGSILRFNRKDVGQNNGDDITSHAGIVSYIDSCQNAIRVQFRGNGAGFSLAQFRQLSDSTNAFTARVETFGGVEHTLQTVDTINLNYNGLDTLSPVSIWSDEVRVRITCKQDYLPLELVMFAEFVQIITERFGVETESILEDGISSRFLSINLEPLIVKDEDDGSESGIYIVPETMKHRLLPENNDEVRTISVLGVAGDGSEYGWYQLEIEDQKVVSILSIVPVISRNGIPTDIRVTGALSGTRDYLVPINSAREFAVYEMGFSFWHLLLIIFLAALLTKLEDWFKAFAKSKGFTVVMVVLFCFVGFGLSAQNSDCKLPNDWKSLSWMQDVGHCPTCMSNELWLANVKRLYCLRLGQRKLVELEQENAQQAAEIQRLLNLLNSQPKVVSPPPLVNVAPPSDVNVTVEDHDTTTVNVKVVMPKETAVEEPEKVKAQRGYISLFIGNGDGAYSRYLGQGCCPGSETGFNNLADGSGYGLQIGLDPDWRKAFSLAGQLQAMNADVEFDNEVETSNIIPTFSRVRIAALATPKINLDSLGLKRIGFEVGPQLVASHFAPVGATWGSIQLRAGVNVRLNRLTVAFVGNIDVASASWIDGDIAEKAHQLSFEGSVKYQNLALFGEYGSAFSNLGANAEQLNLGGASFKSLIVGIRYYF